MMYAWLHDIEATLERYRSLTIRRYHLGRLAYYEAEEFDALHRILAAALRKDVS